MLPGGTDQARDEAGDEYWARHGERMAARVFLAWTIALATLALAILGLGAMCG